MNRRNFLGSFAKALVAVTIAPAIKVAKVIPAYIPFSRLRRIQPTMIASELIGVQAMAAPTGQIFYMNTSEKKV